MTENDVLAALQVENARLVALLESHGIQRQAPPISSPRSALPLRRWIGKARMHALQSQ
jgi:hypothetical protein